MHLCQISVRILHQYPKNFHHFVKTKETYQSMHLHSLYYNVLY